MLHTYLLVAWFVLPLLVWGAMLCVRRRVHPVLAGVVCLVSVIAGTFVLANYVWALDAHLLAEVDKYEPDTSEARRASEEWASDTDRSFLLVLSPVLTAVWYGVQFLLFFGLQWVFRQLIPAGNASTDVKTDSDRVDRQGDDDKPYQPPIVE